MNKLSSLVKMKLIVNIDCVKFSPTKYIFDCSCLLVQPTVANHRSKQKSLIEKWKSENDGRAKEFWKRSFSGWNWTGETDEVSWWSLHWASRKDCFSCAKHWTVVNVVHSVHDERRIEDLGRASQPTIDLLKLKIRGFGDFFGVRRALSWIRRKIV